MACLHPTNIVYPHFGQLGRTESEIWGVSTIFCTAPRPSIPAQPLWTSNWGPYGRLSAPPGFSRPYEEKDRFIDLRNILAYTLPRQGLKPDTNHGVFNALKLTPGRDGRINEGITHFTIDNGDLAITCPCEMYHYSESLTPDLTGEELERRLASSGWVFHNNEWRSPEPDQQISRSEAVQVRVQARKQAPTTRKAPREPKCVETDGGAGYETETEDIDYERIQRRNRRSDKRFRGRSRQR